MVGNTYYVDTGGISAVLITSPAGHILIDAGGPEATPQVVAHIRQPGFRVEDIRTMLDSHEHIDHAGAIADLQRLSGATVLAWRSEDAGRSVEVVYADSLTSIAAQGLSFSHNPAYPRVQAWSRPLPRRPRPPLCQLAKFRYNACLGRL